MCFPQSSGSLAGGSPAPPDRDLTVRPRWRAGVNTGGSPGKALRRGVARKRTRRHCGRLLGEPGAPSGPGRLQPPAPACTVLRRHLVPRAPKLLGPCLLPFHFFSVELSRLLLRVMNGQQMEAAEGEPAQLTACPRCRRLLLPGARARAAWRLAATAEERRGRQKERWKEG